ncbi:Subunit of heteropentameric Replication factor C (RF-C) [Blastocladiella emersonii ATCC 22665]|nr:Subunit of heteropentameric Replication factor C (RF-C) [Blastocladiella emersonii ATCC 22665]
MDSPHNSDSDADRMDVDDVAPDARQPSIAAAFAGKGKGKGKATAKPSSALPVPPPSSTSVLSAPGAARKQHDPENLPWVEKYRPVSLDDLVSHKEITATITKFIDERKLPHLLFYGPPGTGKTSTIMACARRLYGPQYKSMILELNASDDRGIDVVREQIKNFASTRKIFSSGFKLIVLDEADAMTQPAQAALRRVIEKYTRNVRFCIICNYVSKIIPAVQSRCTRFRFNPLEHDQIADRLRHIASAESVELTDDGMQGLLRLSGGDMRRAVNVLQSAHAAFGVVDENAVYTTTAAPLPKDVERCTNWLLNEEFSAAVQHLATLRTERGYALQDLLADMFKFVRSLDMGNAAKLTLYEAMADIEYKLSQGCSDRIQAGALAGAFRLAVELALKESNSQQQQIGAQ